MKTILTISFLLLTIVLHAQTDRERHDSVARVIQTKYNASQANAIYQLTAEQFRQRINEEQFTQEMQKFGANEGRWQTLQFHEVKANGVDYLSKFEHGQQIFSLKLDAQGRIVRMNFAPAAMKSFQVASNNPMKDSLDKKVEKLVRPYIQKENTAGLTLAIIDGKNVRKYSYGTVDKTRQELPDPAGTLFEIGSVTKTFTALLLAKDVIAGRSALNDPINKYLPDSIPELSFQGHPILLKHLSNHSSGLPRLPDNIFKGTYNLQDPYQHYGQDSMYAFLKNYHLTVDPGTVFAYSNYAVGLLGALMERRTGRSFEELVVKEICQPLGMQSTGINVKGLAQGYNEKGVATPPWDLASLKGAGALRSTLNDMILYTQAQIAQNGPLHQAISFCQQPTFTISGQQPVALGWLMGRSFMDHSGGTGGFRSYVGFDKGRQFGVVILSNTAEEVSAIGQALLKQ